MDVDEKIDMSIELQKYHYIFRAFWDLGEPIIVDNTSSIKTAAISFDEKGNGLNLLINKNFWGSLNKISKSFIICHECLHFILEHGKRFVEYFNRPEHEYVNIAADIVINELLINSFEFEFEKLDDFLQKEGCFIHTVFNESDNIKKGESVNYYLNKLIQKFPEVDSMNSKGITKHILTEEDLKNIKEILEDNGLFDSIDGDLKEILEGAFPEGSLTGNGTYHTVEPKKERNKFEEIIKKWTKKKLKEDFHYVERWDRESLRYGNLISQTNIKLPSISMKYNEYNEYDMLDVFLFLDSSNSCIKYKDIFFTVAANMNPNKFNIRLFSFDTKVKELDIKTKRVYGGGGTRFNIIENKIQEIKNKEKIKYPEAVFIITDGYGNLVYPEKPENWYWFMTSGYSANYIPKKSQWFELKKYIKF